MFAEKFKSAVKNKSSHLVIGLDTDILKVPRFFYEHANPIYEFNRTVIEATSDIAVGYKLNTAFYEGAGELGLFAFKQTLLAIPDDMIKICDGKRGDIDNTDELYARTYFDNYKFDALTASPYMGVDSLKPFIRRKDKVTYVLVLTSNPGAEDFQKLSVNDQPFYNRIAEKFSAQGNNVGFVIGANHTKEMAELTAQYPDAPILIPGIGAQKHDLESLMNSVKTENFVINSGRSIIYAAKQDCTQQEFTDIVREKALELKEKINSYINR